MEKKKSYSSTLEDEFIGKSGVAETFIGPAQRGKIYFKGTSWDARSQDTIEPGEKVTIIGNDSIILIIKSTKSLL
ncbi:MAG: NfeD family protein [Chitinophagaceae bacterium]|nr:NfeD family protein [Chitinophagaceae bacterium]